MLADGHYHWHHNLLRRAFADGIATAINNNKGYYMAKAIMFHRAEEKSSIQPQAKSDLFTFAAVWRLEMDLDKQLKFPARIRPKLLQPDMIIVSDSIKQLIILELRMPWEDCMEEADERKHVWCWWMSVKGKAGECTVNPWRWTAKDLL